MKICKAKPGKAVKILRSDIGRWITARWADTGRQDCLLVEVDSKQKEAKVFQPFRGLTQVDFSQIVEKRNYVQTE